MLRRLVPSTAVVLSLICSAPLRAQPLVTASAGALLANGRDTDFEKPGWVTTGGVLVPVNVRGVHLGGQVMLAFGERGWSSDDERMPGAAYRSGSSNLLGAFGVAAFRLGGAGKPGIVVRTMAGVVRHNFAPRQHVSETSATGVAYGGGAGLAIPLGRVQVNASADFLAGTGRLRINSIVPIQLGFSIPLHRP